METKQLPKRIELTIQEEDRQKAAQYQDNYNCLVATALKRMGYNHDTEIMVYPGSVVIGDSVYLPKESICSGDLYYIPTSWPSTAPHYRSYVVGKKITLIRRDEPVTTIN